MAMHKIRPMLWDIFTDPQYHHLADDVRLTAIGLRGHADDHGRELALPYMVRASIWPGDPTKTDDVLATHMLELDEVGYIGIWSDANRSYFVLRDWPKPSHPTESKYPAPPPELFQRDSSGIPAGRSAWEGEREWERESEGDEWSERPAGLPPSPFCKLHQPNGTRANCRHCGTARLAHDDWLIRQQAGADDDT